MNRNTTTGQLYAPLVRDMTYCVLVTAPGLEQTSCTEVALMRLENGEHTVVYVDKTGNIIFEDPCFTYVEEVARDLFRYRTQREFEQYHARRKRTAPPDN